MHYVTRSTLGRKMGLTVLSTKNEDDERSYAVKK